MKDLGIKLTFYDFLGYLIPGFLFCFLVIYNDTLNSLIPRIGGISVFKSAFLLSFARIKDFFSSEGILLGGTAVLITYIIGHVVTFLGFYLLEFPKFIKVIFKLEPANDDLTAKLQEKYRSYFGLNYTPVPSRQHLHQVVSEYMPASFDTLFFFLTTAAYCRSFALTFIFNALVQAVMFISYGAYGNGVISLLSSGSIVVLFLLNFSRFRRHHDLQLAYAFLSFEKFGKPEKKEKKE
jgi:hypothetical protein